MDLIHAFWLAVIQGITEFLPISSSAHLVLVPRLLGWPDQGMVFDIAVHVGTLLAVVIYFRHDVKTMIIGTLDVLHLRLKTPAAHLTLSIGVATLPVVVAGVLFAGFVSEIGRMIPVLAFTSIAYGLLLWYADRYPMLKPTHDVPSLWHALGFGLFQAAALVPGTSRSGACVTAGRLMGFDRHTSGAFASLMAIPTILMAGAYSLIKEADLSAINWATDQSAFLVGIAVSCITALLGIHLLMTLLTKIGYWPFVIYRVFLGIFLLVVFL